MIYIISEAPKKKQRRNGLGIPLCGYLACILITCSERLEIF